MLSGGRILHHCRVRLPHAENTLLITGYQAEGTLGRALLDGARTVRIHKGEVPVLAEVREPARASPATPTRARWCAGCPQVPRRPAPRVPDPRRGAAASPWARGSEKERGFPTHVPGPDEGRGAWP